MNDLVMQLPDAVCDVRGLFHVRAIARQREDGSWEGWLEFVPADRATSLVHATPVETHQRDRVTMERWVSGLTRVYAEGALSRAQIQYGTTAASQLLFTLEELVEALDRRIPQVARVGEAEITADAIRLRACAMQRIALLRAQNSDLMSSPCTAEIPKAPLTLPG